MEALVHNRSKHWPVGVAESLFTFVQGIPAIVLGFVALFFLPNRPESTTYLTERERMIAVDRMNRATSGDAGAMVNKGGHLMRCSNVVEYSTSEDSAHWLGF